MLTLLVCFVSLLSGCDNSFAPLAIDATGSPDLNKNRAVLTVTPSTASVDVGITLQFTASDGSGKPVTASWSSSNPALATVTESGLVTGVAHGAVTITAKSRNLAGSASVNVVAMAATLTIESVEVSPGQSSLAPGGVSQLVATVRDSNGSTLGGGSVEWSSSNPTVATVSSDGVVTAVASGSALITARAGHREGSAAISVASATTNTPDFGAIIRGVRPRGFGQGTYTLLQPAGGTMYWVAPNGNDNNPGTSSQPFRTINRSAQVAVAGDVVTIRDGVYQESVLVRNSGTADKRIVFQAENRGGVVLSGGQYSFQSVDLFTGNTRFYVTVRGLIFREYAPLDGQFPAAVRAATGWFVEDCFFDSPGQTGLIIWGSDVLVTRSTFQYAFVNALTAWGPKENPRLDIRITDTVIRYNHTNPNPLTGTAAEYVVKLGGTRGTIIDNVESYENNGPGFWFDGENREYVIRNSYFHGNKDVSVSPRTGRGLHLEINWAPGSVHGNVFANNAGAGIGVSNSRGVEIRDNLFVSNHQSVSFTNADRGADYTLKDIHVHRNLFKDWKFVGGVHSYSGTFVHPSEMNILADHNVYDPLTSTTLGWWTNVGTATTIIQMQNTFGWERNGRVEPISWPQQ